MHEMGIAVEVMRIAVDSIPVEMAGTPVARVNLKVGKLSAVIPDNLRFCFEAAVRDTPLEGAELVIEEIPVTAVCGRCRHQWTIESPAFACPECRSGKVKIISGRELDITSIEIATED